MKMGLLIRVFFVILTMGGFLYAYINKQNEITELRLEIPQKAKEVAEVKAEITKLQFEIDKFENPDHLMEMIRRPEWRHLKQPFMKEIIEIKK